MKNKNLLIATGITAVILGSYWVYTQNIQSTSNCIEVYVDYGVLNTTTPDTVCIEAHKNTYALNLLSKTSYKFEYIDFGGDLGKAVCTVNKLPKISCDQMDWKSYWGVFVKHGQNNLNPNSHWNMAQTGISNIQLHPGDSIGLVYLNKGKVRYPDDNTN